MDRHKLSLQLEKLANLIETNIQAPTVQTLIDKMRQLMATELIAVQFYASAASYVTEQNAEFFREHAEEEQVHYNKLSDRITELGGKPIFTIPEVLQLAPEDIAVTEEVSQKPGTTELADLSMRLEMLAIENYNQAIQLSKQIGDEATTPLFREILREEEEHRADFEAIIEEMTERARLSECE